MTTVDTSPPNTAVSWRAADQPQQCRKLVTSLPGPTSRALQKWRNSTLPAALGTVLPVMGQDAGGRVAVDVDSNELIDVASGSTAAIVSVSPPTVASRVQEQAARLTHTRLLVSEYQEYQEYQQVADHLSRLTPGSHEAGTVGFSSDARAIEKAVRIVRAANGQTDLVVFGHAFRLHSLLSIVMTARDLLAGVLRSQR
jgi:4-aminobutyrate aminotransferase/(S)-3-amino-2-methylpropionate transaminase